MSASHLRLVVAGVLAALLLVLTLVAGYLVAGGRGAPAAASTPSAPTSSPGTLTLDGTGEAGAVPDELAFSLSVPLTRPDLADALDAANGTLGKVLAVLRDEGVAKRDVQTTGLEMEPVYDYHPYDPPTLRGYRVTERMGVRVRDLHDGGRAVSAAVAAGGNAVDLGDLRLLVGDTSGVMQRARTAAIEEARAKAEQYAAASGLRLGAVRTISEVRTRPVPSPVPLAADLAYTGALDSRAAAMPVRAGRDQASVTVRVVWALE